MTLLKPVALTVCVISRGPTAEIFAEAYYFDWGTPYSSAVFNFMPDIGESFSIKRYVRRD